MRDPIAETRFHECAALDYEIRAIRLRRAAESISPAMTLGELDVILANLVVERLTRDAAWVASVRLAGWGEVAVPGLGATPSEALADSLHGLALMLDARAKGRRAQARMWIERAVA